jgi:asparagine synthase (glutamine-hydrolysing)
VHVRKLVLPDSMGESWVARLGRSTLELLEPSDAQIADLGDSRVVFGGILANASEVAASLEVAPGDVTEAGLLLRAYHSCRESLLPRLRGAFGLLILDAAEEEALCVRDPLGVQPLFTADFGSELLVSPSIESLFRNGVSRDVNVPALADHLLHRWPDPTETYFRSVRRVPPGHALQLSRSGRRLYRYWEPLPVSGDIEWIDEDEVELFDELLERAVTTCLGRGSAGVFLSGGLDSVSVAAVAAAATRERGLAVPQALSLVFPGADVDESHLQSKVAASLSLPQVLLPWAEAVGPDGIVQDALDLTARSPSPLINLWASPYDRLAREGTSRGCDLILSGSGGDEWLGVSPLYAADLIRSFNVAGLYKFIGAQSRSHHLSQIRFVWNVLWRFGARPIALEAIGRSAHGVLKRQRRRKAAKSIPEWIAPAPEVRRSLVERALASDPHLFESPSPSGAHHFYLDAVRQSFDHALVSIEMEETFAQGRRVGASILAPYWDADLLEFLCRTPPELLNRGGRTKGLVRDVVARRFPELGFERQKKVSSLRFAMSVFSAELPRAWASLNGAPTLAEAGIVDRAGSREFASQALLTPNNGGRSMQRLWDIINLEVWLRSQLEGGGQE